MSILRETQNNNIWVCDKRFIFCVTCHPCALKIVSNFLKIRLMKRLPKMSPAVS